MRVVVGLVVLGVLMLLFPPLGLLLLISFVVWIVGPTGWLIWGILTYK